MSFGAPEESEEEKRRRKAAERRARADRMRANQEFTADRTAFLARRFGVRNAANAAALPARRFGFGRGRGGLVTVED
ncbi:MAG: hypothetical protein ACOC91_00855 [bacterium]